MKEDFGSSVERGLSDSEQITDSVWDEAFDRAKDSMGFKEFEKLMEFTASEKRETIEDYLDKHTDSLTPEVAFFMRMSIERKKEKELREQNK